MKSLRALPLGTLLALSFLAACSSSGGSDAFSNVGGGTGKGKAKGGAAGKAGAGSVGTAPIDEVCAPGTSTACDCASGQGLETCLEDGSGYDECVCASGGAAGAAKGGAAGSTTGGTGGKGDKAGGGGAGQAGEGGAPDGEGGAGGNPFDPGSEAGGEGGAASGCVPGNPAVDGDGDGFTAEQGDCNDCDPVINPGAFERANDGADNDCDGTIDNALTACDASLAIEVGDPANAARAIGICNIGVPETAEPKDRKWGLISSSFSNISGAYLTSPPAAKASIKKQLGILPGLGSASAPQEGAKVFALSSGIARAPGQADYPGKVCPSGLGPSGSQSWSGVNQYPPGFPKNGDCGETGLAHDGIALDMRIRVPTNAKGFKVRFKFFTCEFPNFTCDVYNDVFAILMSPSPLMAGDPMTDKDNLFADVAFETNGMKKNVIGVNNTSFLTACKKAVQTPEYTKCAGEAGLAGSGFDGHAASGWLQTSVPIPTFKPGADRIIELRFAIWDSDDSILDSTAIVDAFEWDTEAPKETETRVEN